MKYYDGLYYQLAEPEQYQSNLRPPQDMRIRFAVLRVTGLIEVAPGYAWNGADWSMDTDTNIRGSMFHDIICEMMAAGLLDRATYWDQAADMYYDICLAAGMSEERAAVDRMFMKAYKGLSNGFEREVLTAP